MPQTLKSKMQAELERLRGYSEQLLMENKSLKRQVYIDELTRFYNYRYMMKRLDEELSRAKRHDRKFSLIVIDVDNLKKINDSCGHQMGNQVLVEVSNCIKNSLRDIDIATRFGGDEFVILLPDTSMDNALAVARRIASNVEQLSFFSLTRKKGLKITISAGVSTIDDMTASSESFLEEADKLLNLAKSKGKNCIESKKTGYNIDISSIKRN